MVDTVQEAEANAASKVNAEAAKLGLSDHVVHIIKVAVGVLLALAIVAVVRNVTGLHI